MSQPSDGSWNWDLRLKVILVSIVQFINILEFMMIMPLGPDLAADVGISLNHLGYVGGFYTAAAFVAGILGSLYLERFERRRVLCICLSGLMIATGAAVFANSLPVLLGLRMLAGFFGGPATSTGLAMLSDLVPPAHRGKAFAIFMSSFSAASIFGIPLVLELSKLWTWRAPFVFVFFTGLGCILFARILLPRFDAHLFNRTKAHEALKDLLSMLRNPLVVQSLMMNLLVIAGAFMIIPNIAAFVQYNLGFPRDHLGSLYLVGGSISFLVLNVIGSLIDKYGAFICGLFGTVLLVIIITTGFLFHLTFITLSFSVYIYFSGFMSGMNIRNVAGNALTSRIPKPDERARFMSLQSAVQHLACASGAFISSAILDQGPSLALVHMDVVSLCSIALISTMPFMMWCLSKAVV